MHNLSLLVDIGLTDLPRSAGATDDTIILFMYLVTRDGGVGGRGLCPPPLPVVSKFGNSIPTRGADYAHHITTALRVENWVGMTKKLVQFCTQGKM